MKGQVAFEYMIIIAIVLAFIMPIWAYNVSLQNNVGAEISIAYAKNAARKITDTADLVNSQGPPAKVSVNIYIPEGVVETNISSNRVNLKVMINNEVTDAFENSDATLNGSLPSSKGNYIVVIEAVEGYVQITPQIS